MPTGLSADTLYQAFSERALLNEPELSTALGAVSNYLERLRKDCSSTVTKTLVGFDHSKYGVMIHFVVLSNYAGITPYGAEQKPEDIERHAVFAHESSVMSLLREFPNLGICVHLAADREFANYEEMEEYFVKCSSRDSVNVKFVGCFENN